MDQVLAGSTPVVHPNSKDEGYLSLCAERSERSLHRPMPARFTGVNARLSIESGRVRSPSRALAEVV